METTFGPNLTFRDEYLENQIFPGGAVFAGTSNTISTTIIINEKCHVHAKISRKSRKTVILTTFLHFMDDPDFSPKIGLRHFLPLIDV